MSDIYLLDKKKNQYIVHIVSEDTNFFQAYILWKRTHIGRINWLIEDSEMKICDLVIFDDPVMPRNGLFSFPPFRRPHRNFRALGLGTAMLRFIIERAERLKVNGISGFITPDDERQTPYLLDFYRKHGFTVNISHDESSNRTVSIYRENLSN